ncbi:prepilin-type N-terminal cleavage/methylation domain-containing protein [Candidatus Omnitrophota bacterium]
MLSLAYNKKGMTFIEVIVAAALVALVVVSLFAAVTQTSVFSKRIDRVYKASYLAQRRIDMLKRLDFDLVQFSEETDVRVDADGNLSSTGTYVRTTEVDTNYSGNPFLLKVKVTVKKAHVKYDGSIYGDLGQITIIGQPIVMETLFCDVE